MVCELEGPSPILYKFFIDFIACPSLLVGFDVFKITVGFVYNLKI